MADNKAMDETVLKGKTLLVVDDEIDLREIVASELEFMGAKVFQAENVMAAQKVLEHEFIDLIVSDIRMPGGTGIDLLDFVKNKNVNVPPVVLITGFADISLEDAFNKGAEALLNKPFKLDDLIRMVVRYTSSFNDRFTEKTPEDDLLIIKSSSNDADVKLGRGGAAVKLNTLGKKFEVGEVIRFELDVNGELFRGIGTCRWFRPSAQELGKAMLGLEFTHLDSNSLNLFKMLSEKQQLVPYIPMIES